MWTRREFTTASALGVAIFSSPLATNPGERIDIDLRKPARPFRHRLFVGNNELGGAEARFSSPRHHALTLLYG